MKKFSLLIIGSFFCLEVVQGQPNCPSLNVIASFFDMDAFPMPYTYNDALADGNCYTIEQPLPSTVCFEYQLPASPPSAGYRLFLRGCGANQSIQGGGCNSASVSSGPYTGAITYDANCNVVNTMAIMASCSGYGGGTVFDVGDIVTICFTIDPAACTDEDLVICPILACPDANCHTTLPVILKSFSVTNNIVEWETATEINFSHFSVEYMDGDRFEPASGNIAAKGIFPNGSAYSYTHQYRQENSAMYYRLRMTDFDGTITYSPIIVSNTSNNDVYYSNNYIYLNKFNDTKSSQEILIYDLSGKLFFSNKMDNHEVIPWEHKGVFILHIPELNQQFKITAF